MASHRITVRLSKALGALLRDQSRARGQTASELVRIALRTHLGPGSGTHSAYDLAEEAGLIGCVRHAPKDLSTNRSYFEHFGKNN